MKANPEGKNQTSGTLQDKRRNEEEMKAWRLAMGRVAILTDFHDRYEPISELGTGGFAKVILNFNVQRFF